MRVGPRRTKKGQEPPAAQPPPTPEPAEDTAKPDAGHTRPDIVRPTPAAPSPASEPEPEPAPDVSVGGAHKKRSRFGRRKQIVVLEPVALPARSGLTQPIDPKEHVEAEPPPEPPAPEAGKPG